MPIEKITFVGYVELIGISVVTLSIVGVAYALLLVLALPDLVLRLLHATGLTLHCDRLSASCGQRKMPAPSRETMINALPAPRQPGCQR